MNKIIVTEEQLNLLNGRNERLVLSLHEEYLHEFMKSDPYTDKNLIKTELEKEYKVISINIDSYNDLESTIVDMLLCCGSDKFIGSPYSTMSIFIFILRGKIYREYKCINDSIIYLKLIKIPKNAIK